MKKTICKIIALGIFIVASSLPAFADNYAGEGGCEKRVLFDLSHDALNWPPLDRYYAPAISRMGDMGFCVDIADAFDRLDEYDIVIAHLPGSTYSNRDAEAIGRFLDDERTFILTGEYRDALRNPAAANELLTALGAGIRIAGTTVMEPNEYYLHQVWLHVVDMSNHCLNRHVAEMINPAATHLEIENPQSALYFSSPDSYLDGMRGKGPFTLAAVADPDAHPDWRLMVLGDTNWLSETSENFLALNDNAVFLSNALYWCENPCASDSECDDGLYCNGREYCDAQSGRCALVESPCAKSGEVCNETDEACEIPAFPDDDDDDDDDESGLGLLTSSKQADEDKDSGWPAGGLSGGCGF